jgi:6-phosphogluconate dehydrogenase
MHQKGAIMTKQTQLQYGVMGLGRMGGNLARQALEKGIRVVGFVRREAPADLIDDGLEVIWSVDDFRNRLPAPRVVFLYIPAGLEVDSRLDELASALERRRPVRVGKMTTRRRVNESLRQR